MYQLTVFIFIVLPAFYLGRNLFLLGVKVKDVYKASFSVLKNELNGVRANGGDRLMKTLYGLKRILYYTTIFLALILILSGFIPVLLGKHLFGIFLLIHVLAAPFFCLSAALLILFSANRNSFSMMDLDHLRKKETDKGDTFIVYQKISFWVFSFFSIPAIMSIALSLFPVFGTEGLSNLLLFHQISVLILTLSLLVHSYFQIILYLKNDSAKI
jgi:hypothetical protein